MFEALVRTVEAIDVAVCVEALDLDSRGIPDSSPGFSIG
jgi:hypothetical protein